MNPQTEKKTDSYDIFFGHLDQAEILYKLLLEHAGPPNSDVKTVEVWSFAKAYGQGFVGIIQRWKCGGYSLYLETEGPKTAEDIVTLLKRLQRSAYTPPPNDALATWKCRNGEEDEPPEENQLVTNLEKCLEVVDEEISQRQCSGLGEIWQDLQKISDEGHAALKTYR